MNFKTLVLALFSFTLLPLVAQEPAPAAAVAAPKEAKVEKEPIDMFEVLDYDEETDTLLEPGTKTGYTGPVYSMTDDGTARESEGYLKDGHEEGWWIEYFPDGTKSFEGLYKNGLEEGYWSYWHENGQFQSGGLYVNGSPAGEWVSFFETGKKDSVGTYVDGLMDGDWLFYDEETDKPRTIKFEKGKQLTK